MFICVRVIYIPECVCVCVCVASCLMTDVECCPMAAVGKSQMWGNRFLHREWVMFSTNEVLHQASLKSLGDCTSQV